MNAAMFHIYLNNLFENLRHYQIAGTRGKLLTFEQVFLYALIQLINLLIINL